MPILSGFPVTETGWVSLPNNEERDVTSSIETMGTRAQRAKSLQYVEDEKEDFETGVLSDVTAVIIAVDVE